MEQTLVLIKPDAVERNCWFEIMEMYQHHGLKIKKAHIVTLRPQIVQLFYSEHIGKNFYPELVAHMTSGPVIALIISGDGVIKKVRELNGATKPEEADPSSIRGLYGTRGKGPANAVHGSADFGSAQREIRLIFE